MSKESEITIAGAGPSGMTAAIILAKAGYRVRVFEQRSGVGGRFNDDFQGLENWSRVEDVLDEIKALGIEPTWWCRPFSGMTVYDPDLRPIEVGSPRPLFYMVRRGSSHPASLDLALLNQARDVGVEFVFEKRVDSNTVDIVATGPKGRPLAVAAGVTFTTDREDYACAILNNALAPSGYVYFLIADGQATLATVLLKSFTKIHKCLDTSIDVIKQLFDTTELSNVKRWTAHGTFSIPQSGERNGTLWVGESAGFQDCFLGFGIRNAMVSAGLAAQSIIQNTSYDELWRTRLLPHLKASVVNRVIYEKLGNPAKRGLWLMMGKNDHPERFLLWLYSYSAIHRMIYHFVQKRHYDSLAQADSQQT